MEDKRHHIYGDGVPLSAESEHGLEEDAVSYESYHRECSGNRSASIRRNVDNREPVSFMVRTS